MKRNENRHCQCCGVSLECKSGAVKLCQCQTVVLSAEQLEFIGSRYHDCLCATCLIALRDEFNMLQTGEKAR